MNSNPIAANCLHLWNTDYVSGTVLRNIEIHVLPHIMLVNTYNDCEVDMIILIL